MSEQRSFPILTVDCRALEPLSSQLLQRSAGHSGQLWALQQLVFDTRMQVLQHMIAEDLQPCSEPMINISLDVRQRAVSTAAGPVGMLPPDYPNVVVYRSRHFTGKEAFDV